MKIRNGFVSNSSSSSFVVVRKKFLKLEENVLTPEEEKKLVDYGFKRVGCYRADQVDCDLFHETKKSIVAKRKKIEKTLSKKVKAKIADLSKLNAPFPDLFNYGYSVTCNQDDIIYFLLKNNIPFEANCHYGDYNVVYHKNQKYFLILQNYGIQCRVSDNYKDALERTGWVQEKPIEKVSVKKWLEREEKWQKESEDEIFTQEMSNEDS